MNFREKLRAVFDNCGDMNARYRPRSINGGTGWLVWDAAEERFLSDAEVKPIDPYEILQPRKER